MVDPEDASARMRRYLESSSDEEKAADIRRAAPGQEQNDELRLETAPAQLALHPQRAGLPLDAYLACALTGLDETDRQLVFHVSDTVSVICAEYGIEVYEPRKKTDPVHHADISAERVYQTDRDRVLGADLLIHLAHFPSTGSGEELEFAHAALLPILLISPGNARVSRMITGIPGLTLQIAYDEPEDLRHLLREALLQIRPLLEERKLALSSYDRNVVGDKVRLLRQSLGLTREDIAGAAGSGFSAEELAHLEESSDRLSNPSLMQLRALAAALNTTVAELVEPNLGEHLVNILNELMAEPAAARFSGVTDKDRRRLLRSMVARMHEALQDDE